MVNLEKFISHPDERDVVYWLVETISNPKKLNKVDYRKLFEIVDKLDYKALDDLVILISNRVETIDDNVSTLKYSPDSIEFIKKFLIHLAKKFNKRNGIMSFAHCLTCIAIHHQLFSWEEKEWNFVKKVIRKHRKLLLTKYRDPFSEEIRIAILKFLVDKFSSLLDEDLIIEFLEISLK